METEFDWKAPTPLSTAMDEVRSLERKRAYVQKKLDDLTSEYDLAAERLRKLLNGNN